MRRLAILLVLAGISACLILVPSSSALFNSTSTSTVNVTTDTVQNWLHLYSQTSDPDGLGGYWQQAPTTNPAATGTDATLSVNLGTYAGSGTTPCDLVFTINTPTSFPTGSPVTVTATVLADESTGLQPISNCGFATVGNTSRTNPITLGVSQKRQVNLKVKLDGAVSGRTYFPKMVITVTYSGLTATYYQYTVPFTVTAQ